MKYKTRIFPEGDGYVGQAIVNDEVVYTTNVVKDSVMVARELSTYIASADKIPSTVKPPPPQRRQVFDPIPSNEVPSQKVNSTGPYYQASSKQELPLEYINPPPRRCCGRG